MHAWIHAFRIMYGSMHGAASRLCDQYAFVHLFTVLTDRREPSTDQQVSSGELFGAPRIARWVAASHVASRLFARIPMYTCIYVCMHVPIFWLRSTSCFVLSGSSSFFLLLSSFFVQATPSRRRFCGCTGPTTSTAGSSRHSQRSGA
jgi:hypothetical protein